MKRQETFSTNKLHAMMDLEPVADPGFPVVGGEGGADTLWGADLRHGRFLAETCAKTKESGSIEGGMHAGGTFWIRQRDKLK